MHWTTSPPACLKNWILDKLISIFIKKSSFINHYHHNLPNIKGILDHKLLFLTWKHLYQNFVSRPLYHHWLHFLPPDRLINVVYDIDKIHFHQFYNGLILLLFILIKSALNVFSWVSATFVFSLLSLLF